MLAFRTVTARVPSAPRALRQRPSATGFPTGATYAPILFGSLQRRALWAACSAVLLLALRGSAAFAEELVVDDADSVVTLKGAWSRTTTTPGFYGSGYAFRTAGDGSAIATFPFPSSAGAGKYEVFARWTSGPNRASNATFQVTSAAGAASTAVDQKLNGGTWRSLGSFDFAPGKGYGVAITDKADGVVVADAIRWVGPGATAPAAATVVATPSPTPVAAANQVAAFSNLAQTPGAGAAQPASTSAPAASPSAPMPPSPAATATPAPAPAPPTPAPTPTDARFFPQTRYRIDVDQFWDFFQKRGGARTFGYPVSNTFTLLGLKVQVFQRQVMQLRPDGGVQTLNLLDEGLMPYTKINGSVFPASDPAVIAQSPKPGDPDYLEKALQFVKDMAPNDFEGNPVGFGQTFLSTVRPEDAFPTGVPEGLEGLVPGFNLEIWGLPTSKPVYDPTNRNFIYQRFQRGIMHYDRGCGCTQGLLLGDYFKALATNRNLPSDLAIEAKSSRFLGQWAFAQPQGLARPNELPGSDWKNAFRRDPVVTIDPGHGGKEIGTAHTYPDGVTLQEKTLNLRVATRLRELLQGQGYDVTITRTVDAGVNTDNKDITADGKVTVSDDLQARIDIANKANADALVSVHFNGVADPNFRGTFTFWAPERPFSDRSKSLAEMVQSAMVKSINDAGYQTVDRGARMDTSVLGGGHYYLLGPKSDIIARASAMPAIIGEPLFLTNSGDADAARQDKIVEAVARGYLEGLKAYFAKYPPS